MLDSQIQVRREIIKMMGGKRLLPLGGSRVVIIPKMWARVNAVEIDGDYYIRVKTMSNSIIQIEPLDKAEIEAMLEGATQDAH